MPRGLSFDIVPVIFLPGICPMNAGIGKRVACVALFAALNVPASAGLFDDAPSGTPPPKATVPSSRPARSGTPLAPASPSESEKLPIPADAARRAALKQVRDVMRNDLANAKTPAAKSQLAGQMLQTADGTSDPAGRYVLLREAENLAADAADVDTALAADDAVNRAFQPDATPSAIDPLQKFTRAQIDAAAAARVCEAALGILHTAQAQNRFEAARQAGRVAVAMAHKANDRELTDRAIALLGGVNAMEAEYGHVRSAESVLKKTPNDPAANATMGRYECFFKGDWAAGLPKLAKGNNEALKKAAADELKPPTNAEAQSAVADAWWAVAEGQSPAVQPAIRAHAAAFYAQALDGLSGLAKLKAEQRIAQARPPEPKATVATARPPQSAKPVTPVSNDDTSPPPAEGSGEIRGPMDVIHAVPADMYPKTLTEWTDDRQAAVNQAMAKAVDHKKGTFQVVVQEIYPASGRVLTRSALVGKISFHMNLRFDADARAQLASVRIGAPYVVTGDIYFPHFTGMELTVTLEHCQLVR